MTGTTVHADTIGDLAGLLGEQRAVLARMADVAERVAADKPGLDVERYLRLAEYATAQAHTHATTNSETGAPMFGFLYVALALLAPPGDNTYADPAEFHGLAFDAVGASPSSRDDDPHRNPARGVPSADPRGRSVHRPRPPGDAAR